MPTYKFHVLAPGTYTVPTPDGKRRKVTFTAEQCQRFASVGNRMLANSLQVPACLEHRSDAEPIQMSADDARSNRARGTVGFVKDYEFSNGSLWANVPIEDPEDAKVAEKIKFCSPRIKQFTDGDDVNWGDVVTHVAITPRPVQHRQSPISKVEGLALSHPIDLSFDPEKGTDMAAGDEGNDSGMSDEKIKKCVDCLKKHNVMLGDDTDKSNFLDRLIVGLDTKNAHLNPEEAGAGGDGNALQESTAQQPLTMSFDTPAEKKSYEKAVAMSRRDLSTRINDLVKSGRVTPVIGKKMLGEAKAVNLSYDDAGDLKPNKLLVQIEAYEALAEKAGTRQPADLSLEEVDPGDLAKKEPGDNDGKEAVKAMYEALGK